MRYKPTSAFYALSTSRSNEEKMDMVNKVLIDLVTHFHLKASRNKNNYLLYRYASIILAGGTSIVSALQVVYPTTFPQWILPVVSAGAAVAVAFLSTSSAQKIWIHSRTTQQQLQSEQFLFNQRAGRYLSLSAEDSIRIFSERLVELWNEGHGKWEQNVKED